MSEHANKKPYIWVNEFTESSVKDFYENFLELEMDHSVPVITVFIDSYGGNVDSLFAMRDLIKSTTKPVATVCVSKAMSAGAALLASGTKGLRFMSKDSEVMIHELSSGSWGKNHEIQSTSKWLDKMNKKLIKNLAEDMGKPVNKIEQQLHKIKNVDWFLSSTQAKRWGVVDHVDIPRIMYHEPVAMLSIMEKEGKK